MNKNVLVTDSPDQADKLASVSGSLTNFPKISFAAIIPVYNHSESVGAVIRNVLHRFPFLPIFVIDDGSTDGTGLILDKLAQEINDLTASDHPHIRVIHHSTNQGKGAALLTGFQTATEATHAVTIDADGQHCINDVFRLLEIARMFPDDLIIGDRQMDSCDVPVASRRGRDISRFWLWAQTGQDVPDSQCGLRVYPIAQTLQLKHIFQRYDFETETLIRHAWSGLRIRSVPVTCIYFPHAERISHFRPFRDTVRGVRINVILTTWQIIYPLGHKRHQSLFFPSPPGKSYNFRQTLGKLFLSDLRDSQISAAVGVGILIGFIPVYGFQTLLAFYVARKIHLNTLITMLFAQISTPPLMMFSVALSINMGELLVHGRLSDAPFGTLNSWHWAFYNYGFSLIIGGLICGILAGATALLLTRTLIKVIRNLST
ncbi:MAG TPA: DUF2062 domain-containing protein [Phycisphaerae bacterium]|nr:DUF2062 domain-containing protein [Phycisphaerae bacterium]